MIVEAATSETELFINGESTPATGEATLTLVDPATGEEVVQVAAGTEADVDEAVASARDAVEHWTGMSTEDRAKLFLELSDALLEREDELATLEMRDTGKPISQARSGVRSCARYFEYYAGVTDKIRGDSIPVGDDYVDYTVREPLGVTGHIIPWNFPLNILGRTTAPSLASGNTVVIKPDEHTPRTAVEVARIAHEVGFPPGTINVVPGRGSRAGAALSSHPDIDGVSFTGSVETGIEVAKSAVSNVNPVHLELGGKSPLAVFPDADLEAAAETAVDAIFGRNAGQVCTAASRLLVHEAVHHELVNLVAERAGELSLGAGPDDPDVGPLVSEEQLDRVQSYVDVGRSEVGEPIIGGASPDRPGHFFEPTIFDDVDNQTRIAQEEIFGPVLTVIEFADEREAIELSNDVEYGLVAGVFTSDLGRAHRYAREAQAGRVFVNDWFAGGKNAPFGGYKSSGFGREKGLEAIDSFTQIKNVCANIEL